MTDKQLHEVLVELLHTDTAIFLASGPSPPEIVERLDGLTEVQVALDEVRQTVRSRFVALLEHAECASIHGEEAPDKRAESPRR